MRLFHRLLALVLALTLVSDAYSQIVYFNNFESNTNGFTAGGSLSTLNRTSLPTDSLGLSSPNQSMYLGRLGTGITKTGSQDEIVSLNVTGLTPGIVYSVAFDLFIGQSWDGSAGSGFGPDSWRMDVNGTNLVNTTFSNNAQGVNAGAYSPQRYSDSSYTSTSGPDFLRFTGADAAFSLNVGGNYASDYSIYRFSNGGSNPFLTFTADATSATLNFRRYGATSDSGDEDWALDNVMVSSVAAVPEPTTVALLGVAVVPCIAGALWSRRRMQSNKNGW